MIKALKIARFLSITLVLLHLSSCQTYREVEMLGVEGYEVESFDTSGAVIKISVRVKNPNGYKIKITNSDLDLSLNGRSAGKAEIDKKIVLPKRSDMVHTFKVKANFKQLAGGFTSLIGIMTSGKAKVKVEGWVKAKALGIGRKVDVDFNESVSF